MYHAEVVRRRGLRTSTPSFVQTWTEWDPREKFKMDTRFRMTVYDVLLNFLIFTPLVILHHQACNGILDFMFLRQFPKIGAWLLFIIGVGIEFLLCFFHRLLLRLVPKDQEIYPILASHAFIYLLTFANISHIRAVGDLYGIYIGEDWRSALKAMSTGLAALVALKAVKNLLSPPLTLTIDSHVHEDVFHTQTLFSTEGDLSPGGALDAFATVGIVHSFVHLYWSGWWSFLDVWLFPGSPALSSLSCIVLGYLGCVFCILVHQIAKLISRRLQNDENDLMRLIFEDIYHMIAGTSVITAWRGFWYGFYVLGDHFPILYKGKDVTSVAAHVISFALLALANVSTSMCLKGIDKDGDPKDGEGVICSVDYFCDYFKDELEEEEQTRRRSDSTARRRPVAMVTGNQKASNSDAVNGSVSPAKQRPTRKKVDDDLQVTKGKQPQSHQHQNNNPPNPRKKKEL